MKKTQIQLRCSEEDKARYEAAAKVAGKGVSEWLRSAADGAAKLAEVRTGMNAKAASLSLPERQVPFNPAGPEVVAVAVKVRKSKKAPVLPAVIEIEAATVTRKVVEQAPVAAPTVPLAYTGESSTFNGVTMYEVWRESGRATWTIVAPPGKRSV